MVSTVCPHNEVGGSPRQSGILTQRAQRRSPGYDLGSCRSEPSLP
jgi:hypothetical protein